MTSPWLTPVDAAKYVGKSLRGFVEWVRRYGVTPDGYVGRERRFTTATLDRVIRMDRFTASKRRAS